MAIDINILNDALNSDPFVDAQPITDDVKLDTDSNPTPQPVVNPLTEEPVLDMSDSDPKQQTVQNNDEPNAMSLAETIGLETGFAIMDEAGEPIVFEDSVNGLIERERMLVDLVRQQTISEIQSNLLNNPMFVQSLAEQSSETSYSSLSIDKLSDEQKIIVLQNSLEQKGLNKDIAQYTISKAIEDKKLDELAGPALAELQAIEQEFVQQTAAEQLKQQQEEEAYMARAQAELITSLNKGEINAKGQVVKIPSIIKTTIDGEEKRFTRQDLYDYISTPKVKLDDGRAVTQYQYDYMMLQQQKTVDDVIYDAIELLTNQSPVTQPDPTLQSRYEALRNKIVTQKSETAKGRADNSNLAELIKQNLISTIN